MAPQPREEGAAGTGSAPTDAYLAMNALLARVLLEVARRRQDDVPGLLETLEAEVLITSGGTTRPVYGHFAQSAWRFGNGWVHELFLNGDRRGGGHTTATAAESMLITLLHEAAHAFAQAHGIKDTSRDGRYHNRRFAEIALQLGLEVEKAPVIGHRTPQLSDKGRYEYADLLADLAEGITLAREPRPVDLDSDDDEADELDRQPMADKPTVTSLKYVFASCRCRVGRNRLAVIRVARGSWRPGRILCRACGSAFEESLTTPH